MDVLHLCTSCYELQLPLANPLRYYRISNPSDTLLFPWHHRQRHAHRYSHHNVLTKSQ
jgi:hypothetical protein